jgi:hypothetical protein
MVELRRHGSAREVEKCENLSGGRSFQPTGEIMEAGKPRSQRFAASLEQALLVPSSIPCVAHLETSQAHGIIQPDLRRWQENMINLQPSSSLPHQCPPSSPPVLIIGLVCIGLVCIGLVRIGLVWTRQGRCVAQQGPGRRDRAESVSASLQTAPSPSVGGLWCHPSLPAAWICPTAIAC